LAGGHQIKSKDFVIAVSGTPGSGKSSFAKALNEAIPSSKVIELNDLVDEFKLFSSVDKMGSKVVKLKELEKKTKEKIKEQEKGTTLILVGHLTPEISIHPDITVVTRVTLHELIKRLEIRKYQKEKIKENIVSESVDYCGTKAKEQCKETYEVETDQDKKELIDYISGKVSGKDVTAPEIKEISNFDELLELVTEGNKYSL
jgi:broad-specificity NMP kinase